MVKAEFSNLHFVFFLSHSDDPGWSGLTSISGVTDSTGLVSDTKHISFVVFVTAWCLIQKSIANISNLLFNAAWLNSNKNAASNLNIFANGASFVIAELGLWGFSIAWAAYDTKDDFWQKHFSKFFEVKIFLIFLLFGLSFKAMQHKCCLMSQKRRPLGAVSSLASDPLVFQELSVRHNEIIHFKSINFPSVYFSINVKPKVKLHGLGLQA